MKRNILKSKKDAKDLNKFTTKKSSNTASVGRIIIGTILLSTVITVFAFYPVSLYINPYMYLDSNRYINMDYLQLKSIGPIQIIGAPKLGFNTLEVSWPVWSDCGPVYIETIQYNIFRKEIYIWIWGSSSICPQVAAWEDHLVEIFIPFPGSWEILCNGKSIIISV